MRNLYKQLGISELASERKIREALIRCPDVELRKDADTVLLNPLRKALYDRSNRSLTEISAVRANMGLSHASDWQNSMAPHYPHTKPPLASKLRNFKKRNKASNKIYIVLSHIIHGNIIIRYSAAALFIFLILKISYAIVS